MESQSVLPQNGTDNELEAVKGTTTYALSKVKTLKGYKLDSLDGEIGKVKDFYFDDRYWTIRYLVADSGDWPSGRQVLISPYALKAVNKEERNITINLTKKRFPSQIEFSFLKVDLR